MGCGMSQGQYNASTTRTPTAALAVVVLAEDDDGTILLKEPLVGAAYLPSTDELSKFFGCSYFGSALCILKILCFQSSDEML